MWLQVLKDKFFFHKSFRSVIFCNSQENSNLHSSCNNNIQMVMKNILNWKKEKGKEPYTFDHHHHYANQNQINHPLHYHKPAYEHKNTPHQRKKKKRDKLAKWMLYIIKRVRCHLLLNLLLFFSSQFVTQTSWFYKACYVTF